MIITHGCMSMFSFQGFSAARKKSFDQMIAEGIVLI